MNRLEPPLTEDAVRSVRAGDELTVSGTIYTARDMAHRRLCAAVRSGDPLPIPLAGSVLYFVGPTPARHGQVIGAAGPTTSSRMDPYSPILIEQGLRAMIGKGYRDVAVREALQRYGAVHLSAIGGAGALLNRHIASADVVAYPDLGTEAIRKLEVVDFPVVVAYDAAGNSVYER